MSLENGQISKGGYRGSKRGKRTSNRFVKKQTARKWRRLAKANLEDSSRRPINGYAD